MITATTPTLATPWALPSMRPPATRIRRKPPMVLWLTIVAVALLSFFVHLLNLQVQRGEKLREAQRAQASRPATQQAAVETPPNHLVMPARRRPLAPHASI